jgi:hypothetical protein
MVGRVAGVRRGAAFAGCGVVAARPAASWLRRFTPVMLIESITGQARLAECLSTLPLMLSTGIKETEAWSKAQNV